ncbi:MAG: winged helix-turn-helix domain-containing protein [Nanoarchaeota archaeon]
MKHKIITLAGIEEEPLFSGIREFPTEEVIILNHNQKETDVLAEKLRTYQVKSRKITIKEITWEKVFEIVKILNKQEENLLINAATGKPTTTAMMTSAAFVNGIRAYCAEKGEITMLPVLKFSYHKIIPEKKMKILRRLYEKKNCCASLEDLSKEMKISLPLVSYHINGTKKSKGLKELGLIETKEEKGKIGVSLSLQGRLIVEGHV